MNKFLTTKLAGILSNSALEYLYDRRRQLIRDRNNRTVTAVILVGGIFLGLMAFIVGMFFIERDSRSYLESRNRVQLLESLNKTWQFSERETCEADDKSCLPFALQSTEQLRTVSLNQIRSQDESSKRNRIVRLSLKIPFEKWKDLSEYLTLVVSLPNMRYYRADVYLNNQKQRSFFLSRPLNFPFETKNYLGSELNVDILIEATPKEPFSIGNNQPSFISTQSEFEKFSEYLTLKRSGRGNWIAIVSRITLALFAIALFLLVDSSSESLGLALFMGFEGLGLAAKHGWLPLTALGPWWDLFAAALCTNLGMIFRVYFFLNLARVGGTSLNRWALVALTCSLPMAFYAMESANQIGAYYSSIQAFGLLIVASVGMIVCLRSYAYIRTRVLPWRSAALIFSTIACVPSIFLSLDAILPGFIVNSSLIDAIYTAHFNSGFLLALSAFFNISTLENRVRALSLVQIKAKQLELELELARSVQNQHMRLPAMPDHIAVECFQDPASYVSGDTYFFNWDGRKNIFTFLLNDVTGHGVQAALKATMCNVMADLIWSRDSTLVHKKQDEFPVATYNHLVCKYLRERFQIDDLHSVCGGEFHPATGKLHLYRSNSPSPIILQPAKKPSGDNKKYEIISIPLRNETVTTVDLRPGAIVILMSDGILSSSRERASMTRSLSDLSKKSDDGNVSLADVKNMITEQVKHSGKIVDDDKTLLMFKWQPARVMLKPIKAAS